MRSHQVLLLPVIAILFFTTMGHAQDVGKQADSADTQRVLAEGIGLKPDDALKDAFRNAVRQVVGAVVDSETRIENDELIDDNVLTYSDGFVKTYEKVSESEKDGLVRVKITAVVERKSVIAKLKAANVTVKEVDGKGLFSEAITKLESRDNASELLKKALADLPTLMTAEVAGKPEFDKETSEIVVVIDVSVDRQAYNAFAKRTEELLKKISLEQTSTLLRAGQFVEHNRPVPGVLQVILRNAVVGPIVTSGNQSCI